MNIQLLNELKEEYPDNIEDIELLCTYINKLDYCSEKQVAALLEDAQQVVNNLYNIHSADCLVDVQVIINEYRNKFDVTDPREIIHVDNGMGYVQ